jgi:hypothetical protein
MATFSQRTVVRRWGEIRHTAYGPTVINNLLHVPAGDILYELPVGRHRVALAELDYDIARRDADLYGHKSIQRALPPEVCSEAEQRTSHRQSHEAESEEPRRLYRELQLHRLRVISWRDPC